MSDTFTENTGASIKTIFPVVTNMAHGGNLDQDTLLWPRQRIRKLSVKE